MSQEEKEKRPRGAGEKWIPPSGHFGRVVNWKDHSKLRQRNTFGYRRDRADLRDRFATSWRSTIAQFAVLPRDSARLEGGTSLFDGAVSMQEEERGRQRITASAISLSFMIRRLIHILRIIVIKWRLVRVHDW